ncbi:MAG: hypothetical protein ABSB74_00250 [Tepidisphaeraceae bacterium]|jgi:hypothetical protein
MATPEAIGETLPNGPAWAGILAAGVGCASLGLLIDMAEASKTVSNALNFYNPTGDLSGKTTLAVIVWLIAWALLHASWKNRRIQSPGKITLVTLILIVLALIAVFPPFFGLLAAG